MQNNRSNCCLPVKYYLIYSLPTVPTGKWTSRALFTYYFSCPLSKALAVEIEA